MSTKLIQQHLRNTIRSLNDNDFMMILNNIEKIAMKKIEKTTKSISYKCYETSILYETKKFNGYGRSEQESINNCMKNFLESLIENENNFNMIIKALKKQEIDNTEQDESSIKGKTTATTITTINPGNVINEEEIIVIEKGMNEKEKEKDDDKIDMSLALNMSINTVIGPSIITNGGSGGGSGINQENNLQNKNVEILSESFGNISIINNTISQDINHNGYHPEADDLALKQILDQVNKNPMLEFEPVPLITNKVIQSPNKNEYRKNKTKQHQQQPQSQLLQQQQQQVIKESLRYLEKCTEENNNDYSSIGIPPSGRNTYQKKTLIENNNVLNLNNINGNTNNNNNNNGNSIENNTKDLSILKDKANNGNNTNITNNNSNNNNNNNNNDKSQVEYISNRRSSLTQNNAISTIINTNSNNNNNNNQFEISKTKNLKEKDKENTSNSNNCNCKYSEQLLYANKKIESLEKHNKILAEENRFLRYLIEFTPEIQNKLSNHHQPNSKSLVETYENYCKSLPTNQIKTAKDLMNNYNNNNIGSYEIEDRNIDDHVQMISSYLNEKTRSLSVDLLAKRKNYGRNTNMNQNQNQNQNPSILSKNQNFNKENLYNPHYAYLNIKKLVPKLKLDPMNIVGSQTNRPSSSYSDHNINSDIQLGKSTLQANNNINSTRLANENSNLFNYYYQSSSSSSSTSRNNNINCKNVNNYKK